MIDTHAHLDMSEFDNDRTQLFDAMHRHGISSAILPGVSVDQWQKQILIAQQFNCMATVILRNVIFRWVLN